MRKTVYREADLSKITTVPIASRMQGWAHGQQIGKENPTPPPPAFNGVFAPLARQDHYIATGEDLTD